MDKANLACPSRARLVYPWNGLPAGGEVDMPLSLKVQKEVWNMFPFKRTFRINREPTFEIPPFEIEEFARQIETLLWSLDFQFSELKINPEWKDIGDQNFRLVIFRPVGENPSEYDIKCNYFKRDHKVLFKSDITEDRASLVIKFLLERYLRVAWKELTITHRSSFDALCRYMEEKSGRSFDEMLRECPRRKIYRHAHGAVVYLTRDDVEEVVHSGVDDLKSHVTAEANRVIGAMKGAPKTREGVIAFVRSLYDKTNPNLSSWPKVVGYVRTLKDKDDPNFAECANIRALVQGFAKKEKYGIDAAWRSIAQEVKPSHRCKRKKSNAAPMQFPILRKDVGCV